MENRAASVSINDVPEILATIRSELVMLIEPIVAFQALWYGDTQGWHLQIEAVTMSQVGRYQPHILWYITQSELLSFNMALTGSTYKDEYNPSNLVRQLGETLAQEYAVPFYFPSPDKPDEDCPNWWQQDQAVACTRCGKPILQTSDDNGRCYPCSWEVKLEKPKSDN